MIRRAGGRQRRSYPALVGRRRGHLGEGRASNDHPSARGGRRRVRLVAHGVRGRSPGRFAGCARWNRTALSRRLTSHRFGDARLARSCDRSCRPSHESQRDPYGRSCAVVGCHSGLSGLHRDLSSDPCHPAGRRGTNAHDHPMCLPTRRRPWPPAFPDTRRARQLPSHGASPITRYTRWRASASTSRHASSASVSYSAVLDIHLGHFRRLRDTARLLASSLVFRLRFRLGGRATPARLLR